jgi:hypothetical protein
MSSYKTRAHDQRVVEEVAAGKELMCAASGCPHCWSVDAGAGRLCSWHAWSDPHLWPQITQEQLESMADKARQRREPVTPKAMSRAEKAAAVAALREVAAKKNPRKDWARRIVERVRNGARVTPLVLKMAQAVARRPAGGAE